MLQAASVGTKQAKQGQGYRMKGFDFLVFFASAIGLSSRLWAMDTGHVASNRDV